MKRTTKKTKRLQRLDRIHVWHPFTQMSEWEREDPLIIERGRGNYLFDTDGNRFLDGVSSLWVNVHGHRKKEIDAAVRGQLNKIAHSTLLGLAGVPSIELAERLVKITPRGLTRVFFSDNGSTAVEAALKIAFQYWYERGRTEKKRFIAFTGAYHGDTLGSMGVGEIGVFVKKYKGLISKKPLRAPYPYCYRCPVEKTYPKCKIACLNVLERILERHGPGTAACIIEPVVQGAAGIIVSPPGFLKGVRRLTKKHKVLLIADEVATGFGRTGTMFACDTEGVAPDIMCLAKGITGGYLPMAGTLTTEKIFKAFLGPYDEYKAFLHGHTYTGNALGCAAALASLDLFKKERTIQGLRPKTKVLEKGLERFTRLPHVGDVRQKGLMAGIELVKDKETKRPFAPGLRTGHRVVLEARKNGLIIRSLVDTVVIMPPLSITAGEIKRLLNIVYRAVRGVTE